MPGPASQFMREVLLSDGVGDFNAQVGPYKGNVWFVDSAVSATGMSGKSWSSACATIDAAINKCSANDTILVAPGHAETIAAANAIDADVAGISIIGLGNGTARPTITIGTLTTASVRINAANVRLKNLRFTAGTAQLLVKMIDVAKSNAIIEDCYLLGASTSTFLVGGFINLAT